jgi:hypothetical protein
MSSSGGLSVSGADSFIVSPFQEGRFATADDLTVIITIIAQLPTGNNRLIRFQPK